MGMNRRQIGTGEGRYDFNPGHGYMLGLPERASDCNLTTGVPTNGVAGFAPAAIWQNWLGTIGSLIYVNSGTVTSTTWTNIA